MNGCGCQSVSTLFTLARGGVCTTTTDEQTLESSLDVSSFDALDLMLNVWFDNPGDAPSPTISIDVITGNQLRTKNGWFTVGSFSAVTSNQDNGRFVRVANGLSQFIRWRVTNYLTTGSTAARFRITGIGRLCSR